MDRKFLCAVLLVLAFSMIPRGTHAGTTFNCSSTPGGKVTVDGVMHQMPDMMDCEFQDDGLGGGYEGGGDWGYGGGGGTPQLDLVDRGLSPKLECALSNYLHNDVKLGAGRSMKRVNAYAFGKKNASGVWGYEFRATATPPSGSGWVPIGGITSPGTAYGRMYNQAFQGGNYSLSGFRAGHPDNSISGTMTAFEKSLYVGGHEASHLRGNASNEELADWHGINAVSNYRNDKGVKCAGHSN
jgi:hypothetical protein